MQSFSPKVRPRQYFLSKIRGQTNAQDLPAPRGTNVYPNLLRFVWRRHAGAPSDGHEHGGRKPAETYVTEFCYKSVNFSLEELKNLKIMFFSNT